MSIMHAPELQGQYVTFFGRKYCYHGLVASISSSEILLSDAALVYNVGDMHDPEFKHAQKFPYPVYIRTDCIEAYVPKLIKRVSVEYKTGQYLVRRRPWWVRLWKRLEGLLA